jgi:hypothetical protein
LPIEAVQYIGIMFIATGTKIVEVSWDSTNGWKAVTTTPYQPTVTEAIYIGTNALASDPNTFIQDGVDTSLSVAGIKPVDRTGTVNTTTNMTAFINKPVFPAVSTLSDRTSISVMPNLTNRPAAPVLYTLANKNTFSTVTASKYKSFSKTG